MKSCKIAILVCIFLFLSIDAYSQLWKQYSDSAKVFSDQKKTDKAIEYYYKAKDELKKDSMLSNSHAQICNGLASFYMNMAKYEKAEVLYIEAKNIREKVLGKEHPDYASSCDNLAILYKDMGQYEKAEPLYLEAKQIRERVLGKNHLDYASSCNNLAGLYLEMSQYKKAEPLYLEAKQIREKILGKEHNIYAVSCNNLASLYYSLGHYEKAEPLLLEARRIWEKIFGKEHPNYSYSSNNLANLYSDMGQYKKAEILYLEAKKIREKVLGKEHPNYASSCNNLAALYSDMGEYEKAEVLYLEAKKIREKVLGKEHPDYALSCMNLANLYRQMGLYKKAELLFLEAKLIIENGSGKEHPDYATSCFNLGGLYSDMGQFKKAEPLFLEAKQITEKALGKEHPDYIESCDALAGLYKDMGQFKKAEFLCLDAKQLWEKVFGMEHPKYASSCYNLGDLYSDIGQYKKAKPLLLVTKQIRKKTLGEDHPDYANCCNILGSVYWNLKDYKKALDFYTETFTMDLKGVKKFFQFTSETEKQSYLKNIAHHELFFLSFNTSTSSPSLQGFAYNVSLYSRNLILSSSQQLRNTIYNSTDTSIKNKYNSWISSREQISFWNAKPIADRPAYVKILEEQANTLEKELTRLSSDFRKDQSNNEITWKNIQQILKTNEAAIEFVEFKYYTGKRWTDSTYYIALVLRKNKPEPVLVRLFEKRQIDKLLNSTENLATDSKINTLYAGNRSLYNLAWKPLEKYLTGISKVYFASAGNLFKISFAALPVNDKQVLGDKYQLIQLNTTASVSDNTLSILTTADKIQLYGGIKYDADSATLKEAVALYQSNTESTRSLPADLERGAGFQYLPGTQKETEAIKKEIGNTSIPVTILSGTNATEESVKALTGKSSPSVLHIATHGFFFPDPKDDKRDSIQRKFETSGKAFKQSDNPLFRSGLLFTGANNAWQGKPIDGIEDGILTAYEVSNLYLPNTKLVVLSACETALGDIQGSEGVYGLQRAFKMAGVQNLVMSLWKVPDAETAEFMQLFYKNLFAKQTISNAFYNTQKVMKDKYRAEPYKWAAWVLVM